jgi:hypothetical protein
MKQKINIPANKILKIDQWGMDLTGYLFRYKNRLFRAVYPNAEKLTLELFNSGFLAELNRKKLFPITKITDFKTSNSNLIIEHHEIKSIVYAQELSFNMFKDSALLILEINRIAKKYNFQTIDAHTGNVMFDGLNPYFIDLGSFIRSNKFNKGWFASEEFLQFYYYPLYVWQTGNYHLANSIIFNARKKFPHIEFLSYKYPFLRFIPTAILKKLFNSYFPFTRISSVDEKLLETKLPKPIFSLIIALKKNSLLPFQKFNFEAMQRRITNIKNHHFSYWSKYQSDAYGNFSPSQRFLKIALLIRKRKIKSITDLASNQGFLSRYLIESKIISKAYCLDIDENAIDQLYISFKSKPTSITAAVQNMIYDAVRNNQESSYIRFNSECSLVLAITHHLLLEQHINIDTILSTIAKYTTKYAFVEFMPLGLWGGNFAPPLPDWYSEDWFLRNFKKYFKLEERVQLEKNRILFIGKKHKSR